MSTATKLSDVSVSEALGFISRVDASSEELLGGRIELVAVSLMDTTVYGGTAASSELKETEN